MTEFIVFTLAAPMGAFGDLAGHEWRSSGVWPARSAILGLVGAALGVRRDDTSAQEALAGWRVAVSVLSRGVAFRDFHTVQAVSTARIKRPVTRREALGALGSTDNPLITRRDYRTDCAFGVALWGGTLVAGIREALVRPRFTPYLVLATKASMSLYSKRLRAIDAGEDSAGGGPLARIWPISCDLRLATTHCALFSLLQQAFIPLTNRPVLLAEN